MSIHSLLLLLILAAISAFAALNWGLFVTPAELSLGFTVVQAPLGLVMLGLLIFVTVVFLGFAIYVQTAALLEVRRHARELQVSRELADKAEASRFTELRSYLETEMARLAALRSDPDSGVLARLDRLEADLTTSIEGAGNTLAAYIGELEDRLERNGAAPVVR